MKMEQTVFWNVGISNSVAGELPRRKHTTKLNISKKKEEEEMMMMMMKVVVVVVVVVVVRWKYGEYIYGNDRVQKISCK